MAITDVRTILQGTVNMVTPLLPRLQQMYHMADRTKKKRAPSKHFRSWRPSKKMAVALLYVGTLLRLRLRRFGAAKGEQQGEHEQGPHPRVGNLLQYTCCTGVDRIRFGSPHRADARSDSTSTCGGRNFNYIELAKTSHPGQTDLVRRTR